MPAAAKRPTDGGGSSSSSSGPADAPQSPPNAARSSTLYSVLNVTATATMEELTAAYRKLALVHHPDRPGGSHEKFQELQRAYEVLSSKETRAKYDAVLRGRPALRNFKRPPPLESVQQPVYAMLADGNFYEFEAASSKLKCSFHYGDGIQFNNDRGSFIGLAGDGFIYWIINARGYATRLCEVGSTFALSSVRIMFRSNMGLQRKPLTRSSLPPSSSNRASDSKRRDGAGASSAAAGGTGGGGGGGAAAAMPGGFDARRIKEALLNKERNRHVKKRLGTIDQEELEERNELERELWEQFCVLHTTVETAERCVLQGHAMPDEMALWMGYNFPDEAHLRCSGAQSSHSPGEASPLQAAALWVDPLHSGYYSDVEDEDAMLCDEDAAPPTSGAPPESRAAPAAAVRRPASGHSSSVSSPSARSMSASSSSSNGQGGQAPLSATVATAAAAAPATASSAAPPTSAAPCQRPRSGGAAAAPAVPLTRHEPGDVKQPASSSSPVQPCHLRAVHSLTSSFGNVLSASGPTPHAANAPTSTPSAPGKAPRTLVTPAHPQPLGLRPVSAACSGAMDSVKPGDTPTLNPALSPAPHSSTSLSLHSPAPTAAGAAAPVTRSPAPAITDVEESAAQQFLSLLEARGELRSSPSHPRYPWDAEAQPRGHDSPARGNGGASFLHEAIPHAPLTSSGSGNLAAAAGAVPISSSSPGRPRRDTATPTVADGREGTTAPLPSMASIVVSAGSLQRQASGTPSRGALSVSREGVPKEESPSPKLPALLQPQPPSLSQSSFEAAPRHAAGDAQALSTSQGPNPAAGALSPPHATPPGAAAVTNAGNAGRPAVAAAAHGGASSPSPLSSPPPPLSTFHSAPQTLAVGGDVGNRAGSGAVVAERPLTAQQLPHRYDPENGAAMAPGGDAARASVATFSPESVSVTEAPPAGETSGQRGLAAASVNGAADARVPDVRLPLTTVLEQQQAEAATAELEAAPEDGLLSPDDSAAKKRKQKGKSTPRYMLATMAHVRRSNTASSDLFNPSTTGASPRHEGSRGYSDLTVEELLEEEREFMNSFSKTKRAV